jgi:glycosyltransferase domain-containing protein
MQTLQNLTLITITKNRPESLLNMLKYYDGSGVNFVICDASKKKIKKKKLNFNINIGYHHLPNYSWEDRLIFAIKRINTKYVAFNHDDDFFLISILKVIIKKMEINKNIHAIGGMHYGFTNYNKKIYIKLLNTNTTSATYKKNFEDKIESFFSCCDNTIHSSVFCFNLFRKVEQNIFKNKLNKYNLREIFHGMGILGSGDYKFIDLPLFFRNGINTPQRFNDPANDINDNFATWYFTTKKEKIEKDILDFYKISKLKISKEKYNKIIKLFFTRIVEQRYKNKFYKPTFFFGRVRFLKSKIKYYSNACIRMFVKTNFRTELNKKIIPKNLSKKLTRDIDKDLDKLKNVLTKLM